MTGKWLSTPAVLWAMDDAPGVPPELVSTLTAYARYADLEGRGAYPLAATVAAITRKSVSQARKDAAALARLGLLLPGDPGLVKDIRADRRPKVYDLAMPRDTTRRAQHTPSATTGRAQHTPSGGPRGAYSTSTGRVQPLHDYAHTRPEEFLKNSGTTRGVGASADAPPPRAQTQTRRHAPPCPDCGRPYTAGQLADDEFYRRAMGGDAGCVHPEEP